jgi:hypothetical protein
VTLSSEGPGILRVQQHDNIVSPALLQPVDGAAYELKFLLGEALAAEVESWAGAHLGLDPHADPALGNAYRIHSLYFDTPELATYQRSPSYGRRKFRLRRYGSERGLFLERKTKTGKRVRKRRTRIDDSEVARLRAPQTDDGWAGCWFHRRLQARRLQPTCLITYDRVAHVGRAETGPMRLTLDRHIHAAPTHDWAVIAPHAALQLLAGQVVLELKFRTALPSLFKRLVQEFNLNPQPASKYRLAIEAWGLDQSQKEAG